MATIIKRNTFTILVIIALLNLVIWFVGLRVNVYQYMLLGAFFELAWLPNIIFTACLPIAAGYSWIREKFSLRSRFLYLLVIYMVAFLAVIYL